jgi:hypothetical protein
MKQRSTVFLWGWRDYPRQPDATMTRDRMARLMRAWRRCRVQGYRHFNLKCEARGKGFKVYRVDCIGYDDSATFAILHKGTA